MTGELLLTGDEERLLEEEAARCEVGVWEYMTMLVREKATKLWHVERCRPKVSKRTIWPNEQAKKDIALLELVYNRLKEIKPQAYAEGYGEQEKEWRKLVADGRWEGLHEFRERQPWLRKEQESD